MSISEKIVDNLVDLHIVEEEDKELYSYGFRQGFILLLNLFTTIIIGLIFKMTLEALVLVVSYSFIRGYAGGYHANSPFACYLLSIIMISISLGLMKWIDWNDFLYFTITIVSSIIILLIAPVEDRNKPLEDLEIEIFKKRTNINLYVLIGVILLFRLTGKGRMMNSVTVSLSMISFMLILGKIKNMIIKNHIHQNIKD